MEYKNIYKILTIQEWSDAQKSKVINTDLDTKDGFVHFSNANQLAASLELYFFDYEEVVLLLPKMDKIKPFLKYEKANINSERSGFLLICTEVSRLIISNRYGKLKEELLFYPNPFFLRLSFKFARN